ncbi:MAG: ATP-binding protein [Puniceicoccaceae bacterium]
MKSLLPFLAAGCMYALTAHLTHFFAVDPINYLPVWPAAGVALLFVARFGASAVAGVFAGSLFSVLYYAIRAGDQHYLDVPLLWMGMALGNALQAWICYRTLRPTLENPAKLTIRFHTPWLILRSGVLIPICIAVIIILNIHFNGRLTLRDVPLVAFIWATGNSLGILSMIPLLFALNTTRNRRPQAVKQLVTGIGAFVGVFVVLFVFSLVVRQDIERLHQALEEKQRFLVNSMEVEFGDILEDLSLLNVPYLYDSLLENRDNFAKLAAPILQHNPSLIALALIHPLLPHEIASFEQELSTHFDWPVSCWYLDSQNQRQPCNTDEPVLAVSRIEPSAFAPHALGMDVLRIPSAAPAAKRALQSGKAQIVQSFSMHAGAPRNADTVVFLPSGTWDFQYDGASSRTLLMSAAYDSTSMLFNYFQKIQESDIVVKLHDITEGAPSFVGAIEQDRMLSEQEANQHIAGVNKAHDLYVIQTPIHILDRQWQVTFVVDESYYKRRVSNASVLTTVGGFLLILWFSYYYLQNERSFHRIETLVEQRTEELEEAKNQAEASAKAKADFLAVMSHEIRTPMNGIFGASELLQSANLPPSERELTQIIHKSTRSLLTLINDILDFSKLEAGKSNLKLQPTNLATVCTDAVETLRTMAESKGLELQWIPPEGEPVLVWCDGNRISQILFNLIGNAIKFTDSGHISLRLHTQMHGEQCRVNLVIEDTGIGIPEAFQSSLFQAFTQADSSFTRKHEGTGLGLAICHRLTQLMGGRIDFESASGKGTRFELEFDLDVASELPGTHKPAESAPMLHSGNRVLLVEDNRVNQRIGSLILEREGYEVQIAEDGEQAIKLIREHPYDAVLMDCGLPKLDGYACTRIIREELQLNDLPIIALTAHALAGDAEKCFNAGMNAYLSKPLQRDLLLETLARFLKPTQTQT